MSETSPLTPVFVWRCSVPPGARTDGRCIYCGSKLRNPPTVRDTLEQIDEETRNGVLDGFRYEYGEHWEAEVAKWLGTGDHEIFNWVDSSLPVRVLCDRCGWWCNGIIRDNTGPIRTTAAGLLTLDINDSSLCIPEVCSHLARNYADIYYLSSRRFEHVVAEVYRELGWKVEVTKQSRDGGADLICLSKNNGKRCLVECKKYSQQRKVGIQALDRLLGVQFRTESDAAHLVTTTSFTRDAFMAHQQATEQGIDLRLVDGHELMLLLSTYSDDALTVRDIRAIFGEL